jgi:hypothetical protein
MIGTVGELSFQSQFPAFPVYFLNVQTITDIERAHGSQTEQWLEVKQAVILGINDQTKDIKERQESRLNERKQMKPLQPGTRVMVIDNTRTSKWDAKYEGPFEVVEQTCGGAYVLKDATGEILPHKRTIDMLKVIELPVEEKKISPMAMPSGWESQQQ